jgi:hypothetical protein
VIDKAAFSLTLDAGGESGGGVSYDSQYFVGFMVYNRFWFARDRFGLTVGGGAIRNPGRYLVLMPPINGATALSGTPYFTANPGDPFQAGDVQVSTDVAAGPFVTFRAEYNYREANVPYFSGPGGVTPPGGNTGASGSLVAGWAPDLVRVERRLTFAMLVKL